MTPTLVFDIETIPDTAGLRALLDVPAEATDEMLPISHFINAGYITAMIFCLCSNIKFARFRARCATDLRGQHQFIFLN